MCIFCVFMYISFTSVQILQNLTESLINFRET